MWWRQVWPEVDPAHGLDAVVRMPGCFCGGIGHVGIGVRSVP